MISLKSICERNGWHTSEARLLVPTGVRFMRKLKCDGSFATCGGKRARYVKMDMGNSIAVKCLNCEQVMDESFVTGVAHQYECLVDEPRIPVNMTFLPGEAEAISAAIESAKKFGYGNLIHNLRVAWFDQLVQVEGMSEEQARKAALEF